MSSQTITCGECGRSYLRVECPSCHEVMESSREAGYSFEGEYYSAFQMDEWVARCGNETCREHGRIYVFKNVVLATKPEDEWFPYLTVDPLVGPADGRIREARKIRLADRARWFFKFRH